MGGFGEISKQKQKRGDGWRLEIPIQYVGIPPSYAIVIPELNIVWKSLGGYT